MSLVERIRRHASWLEPWYDWGKTTTWRLDQVERDFSDEAEGEVWLIEIQWFGLRKITPEQVAANKRRAADLERNGI